MAEKKGRGGARPGSGRKPTGIKTTMFQVRIRQETLERLKKLAAGQSRSAASIVRQLIEQLTG